MPGQKLPDQPPPTFLLQLATLLKQRKRRAVGRYVYNEQEYLLELDMPQAGGDREHLLPFRGKVRNLGTGHETPVPRSGWPTAAIPSFPVRIEFQARSFYALLLKRLPALRHSRTPISP